MKSALGRLKENHGNGKSDRAEEILCYTINEQVRDFA